VVTTYHGEMLGDHGYFRKCEPYEGSANIPFIICGSPSLGFTYSQRIEHAPCYSKEQAFHALTVESSRPRVPQTYTIAIDQMFRFEIPVNSLPVICIKSQTA